MTAPASLPIRARGLKKRFATIQAVDGVDLDVEAGETLAIFGANGEGKSTLLRLLSTALRPDAGSLELFGRDARRDARPVRARLGVLTHAPGLYDDLSCRANLEFFARLSGLPDPRQAADAALERFGLALRAGEPARELSRGLHQRLALARSLIHDPELLFLDEPFTGLDPRAALVLDRELRALRDAGRTVVLITHRLDRGLAIADRYVVLRRGRIVESAPAEGVDPTALEARHFPTGLVPGPAVPS